MLYPCFSLITNSISVLSEAIDVYDVVFVIVLFVSECLVENFSVNVLVSGM